MATPPTAVTFTERLDPQEIKDYRLSAAVSIEAGEQIDPANCTLVMSAAGTALGLTIITGSGTYPDPTVNVNGTAIDFWVKVDVAFAGNAAWQGSGTGLSMELTFLTTHSPPRKIQGTAIMVVAEK
jgi:hypothetical protein